MSTTNPPTAIARPRIHYISEWAEERGLTQADIQRALGVNKSTVSKWFSGDLPQETNLLALAEMMAVEPESLFRHPQDDWLSRFFLHRTKDELERMISVLKTAFPREENKNGKTG